MLLLGTAASGAEPDPVAGHVRSALTDYHKGAKNNGRALRVVYFHPSDVAPQADHQARLTRIMRDIKDFYDSELKRIGFPNASLPLEMDDGNLRIHMVKGRDGADGYTHQSGQKVRREIAQALEETMDLRNEFVLIFNGMCEKTGELSYRFYAPYYGDRRSNHREGLCHVADCEIQDPALLKDTKRRMSYNEHYGDFMQTVAGFNTKYLGGVAHELGHGLSLPHNGETRTRKSTLGTALMGSGNHTYRNEVRGEKGSFLTLASAVRLAAHPLFTGSDRGRNAKVTAKPEKLVFKERDGKLIINGTLKAKPTVLTVIAYVDPEGRGDYDALTTVAVVEDGKFTLDIPQQRPAKYELRLVACHANGAITRVAKAPFETNREGKPDADTLQENTGR